MADMEIPDHLSILKSAQTLSEKAKQLKTATDALEGVAFQMEALNNAPYIELRYRTKSGSQWIENTIEINDAGFEKVKEAGMDLLKKRLDAAYKQVEKIGAEINK